MPTAGGGRVVIVLLLGPLGSGKSTIVRRLMKPREWSKFYGHSPLPMAYISKDLVVVGNYETTSRTRHGMSFLERDYLGFDSAMKLALYQKLPVVMEGGFQHSERLWAGHGPMFAQQTHVVYIDVKGMHVERLGRNFDVTEGYEYRALRAAAAVRELGGLMTTLMDRDSAMEWTCNLLGVHVPREPVEHDYR